MNKKRTFTLAEVLIVIGVIGVVAAITMPTLITRINEKVKNTRITTINLKLKQGTDKLMILDRINKYDTTEDFVKALSAHMKISTYCTADKVAECFPYNKINVEGGEGVVDVSDLNSPEAFGLSSDDYSAPVSFITGDGIPYIIMYKKECDIDENDNRDNSTRCIAGIYDWNGTNLPNKFVTNTDEKTGFATTDIQFLGAVTQLEKYIVDGKLNNPTPSGYTTYEVLDGVYNSEECKTVSCPQGMDRLSNASDFNAVFCEIHGAGTMYFDWSDYAAQKYCTGTKNQLLADKFGNITGYSANEKIWLGTGCYNYTTSLKDGDVLGSLNQSAKIICLGK